MENNIDCKFFRSEEEIEIGEIGGTSNQCICPVEKCGIVVWPNFRSHPTGMPYRMCSEWFYNFPRMKENFKKSKGKDWPGCKHRIEKKND